MVVAFWCSGGPGKCDRPGVRWQTHPLFYLPQRHEDTKLHGVCGAVTAWFGASLLSVKTRIFIDNSPTTVTDAQRDSVTILLLRGNKFGPGEVDDQNGKHQAADD